MYRNVLESLFQLFRITCNDDHIGAFLSKQFAKASAHALGATGNHDSLASCQHSRRLPEEVYYPAIDLKVVLPTEKSHDIRGENEKKDDKE